MESPGGSPLLAFPNRDTRTAADDWYAAAAAWWVPLERDARRALGPRLRSQLHFQHLVYEARAVHIAGDSQEHDIEIHFYANPPYETWGLPAEEYPRVFGDPGQLSPHRMPDDGALCLWHPHDTDDRRWLPSDGLLALIEHACRHLFAESWWRTTDAWLLQQAPHGLNRKSA